MSISYQLFIYFFIVSKYNYLYLSKVNTYSINYYHSYKKVVMTTTFMKVHKRWKVNSNFKFVTLLYIVFKLNFIDFLTTEIRCY